MPYSDETLHRLLLGRGLLLFIGVPFTLFHRLVFIKLGEKLLVLLILWDAPLFDVKGQGYYLEWIPPQGLIVPSHVVE